MKTNSSVLSRKFWLAAVTVALFLLPVTAAAQAGNSGKDRIGNINRGRVGVVTTVEPGETLDLNAKLKIRSGGFFLENTALLRAGRGRRVIPSSPPFDAVVLGTENASDYLVFKAGGAERAVISTNGNFGIGTTSPSPYAKVHVYAGTDRNFWIGSDASAFGTNGVVIRALNDPVSGYMPLILGGNPVSVMVGNFGIGTTSPSPYAKLHLYDGTDRNFWIGSDASAFGTNGVVIRALNDAVSGYMPLILGGNPVSLMVGNVGVGTTSPGTINGNSPLNAGTKLQITGPALTGNVAALILNGYDSSTLALSSQNGTTNQRLFAITQQANRLDFMNYTDAGGSAVNVMTMLNNGSVGIGVGTTGPATGFKLDVNGDTHVTGNINLTGTIAAKYQDVAEWVESSEQLDAGTVVVLDSTKSNQVTSSSTSYDTRVAGVISAQPGITLGEKDDSKVLVATTGRVKVKVDASKGAIHIGDLLVTSDVPGVAMRSEPVEFAGRKMHMPGTLIGKALEPLEKGTGEILVLLSLQ